MGPLGHCHQQCQTTGLIFYHLILIDDQVVSELELSESPAEHLWLIYYLPSRQTGGKSSFVWDYDSVTISPAWQTFPSQYWDTRSVIAVHLYHLLGQLVELEMEHIQNVDGLLLRNSNIFALGLRSNLNKMLILHWEFAFNRDGEANVYWILSRRCFICQKVLRL